MSPTGLSLWPATNLSDLRSAFEVLDFDRDGKISRDDLKLSYADADDDLIGTMMTVADSNKDGYVEYHEFEMVLRSNNSGCGSVMMDVFEAMDRDGDGKVGYGDLRSYLDLAGIEMNDDQVKAMIRYGSGDDDTGCVSFDGFLKMLAF